MPDCDQVGELSVPPAFGTNWSAIPRATPTLPGVLEAAFLSENACGALSDNVFAARIATNDMAVAFSRLVVTFVPGVNAVLAEAFPSTTVAVADTGLGG